MRAHQIMTRDTITVLPETPILEAVHYMLENHVSGLPVLDAFGRLVGIVSEGDFLRRSEIGRQSVASMVRPTGVQVAVRNGVVHLHGIIINDDSARRAAIVAAENTAGVKEVHDDLCLVDTWSGFYMESPEDIKAAS